MLATAYYASSPDSTCGIRKLTGFHCPGCGGTRCAYALIQGHFLSALSYNALLFLGLAMFALGSTYLIIRMTILGKPAPSIPDIHARWLWLALGGIALFTIIRNIPTWPFTLLAP